MGNIVTHVTEAGAAVPWELRCAWAQKHDVSISHDGARIDVHGGGKDWRKPTHLTLDELAKVTDTFVVSLVHHRVTSINVAGCISLTDESIKAIAKGCPELKELNVSHCDKLTDESIKAIASGCPELKMLNLSCYLSNLTDESIRAIAIGCPGLNLLDVSSCNNLTDKAIKAIAERCPELRELNVAGIENITDESIKALATGCPECTELNVAGIENLTDESIKAIAQSCPELKELNVAGIENLTDTSIKAIAKGCPELKKLNVEYCRNLTHESIKAIATACPQLTRLNANLCGLTSLPDDIGEWMPELQHLSIADNNLTALPPSIVKLKSLQCLDIDFNPLQSPPYEISKQGLDAIGRYFEELEKGSSVSKLLKVVLVGDGKAGKTTLRNALAGRPKPRQEDRTIHLDIEKITLTDDLDINVYDFGGQEEYLATQLPYLTGLALYVVVVDTHYATDEYADVLEDKLLRFLVVLQNRVPGAVVLPIVTKVDTVEDPERRCHWLETKIDAWLHDIREAVCCDLPDSGSDSPPPSPAASCADASDMKFADDMQYAGDHGTRNFMPLRVQTPPLAVSVADTDDMGQVCDSVKALRDRIIALTKHDPPLLRGVGQQIPSTYVAVLELFGAIAEYGDNDRAMEALRHETAHALGETSKLSPCAMYRPKDELENIWNAYRNEPGGNIKAKVFDDATQLWEAQGLIFVDAGLVILQPEFITTIVKPLVDHRHNDENEYQYFEEVVARFLESSSSWDNGCYEQPIEALDIFRASGEFESSDESLFLSFLWRDTGLEKCHYAQVLQMLTKCGVILKVERDCNVVVVPFRLPHDPDATKLEKFWPKLPPSNVRELKLRFEPRSGFPTGLVERFASDVHGLGTSLYSWRTGVVVTDCAGYSALVERDKKVLHFTVRFESHSTEYADAAWKALCDAQQILAAQRESRFPGLFYMERFMCEECCRGGSRRSSTVIFDANRRESVFRACGHRFYLVCKGKCDVPTVTNNFMGPVSNAQFNAVVNGNANYK